MAVTRPSQAIKHGHSENVLAIDYNHYGDRLVTASSDQRLKVWDLVEDRWELVDAWRAHDAEVTDVKWNGPLSGPVIGSIGEDGFCKLWEEDLSYPPNTGRRFKCFLRLPSKSRLPWVSLDFKNIGTETYLGLITYDGNFCIMEPKDHNNLSGDWNDWMGTQDFWVCEPIPSRSLETGFRICFHHEKLPCWPAIDAGLDRRALSVAVAAMDVVKIYRTDAHRDLYLAAVIDGSLDIIRDVSWANGSARGFDLIASASKDNTVRVYELHTPPSGERRNGHDDDVSSGSASLLEGIGRNTPSGIGARLAGAITTQSGQQNQGGGPGRVKHEVRLAAELAAHDGAVWRVDFSPAGDMIISSGDDRTVRAYKRGLDGQWHEFSEIAIRKERRIQH